MMFQKNVPCFPVALATLAATSLPFCTAKEWSGVAPTPTPGFLPLLYMSPWLNLVTCPTPSKPFSLKSKSLVCCCFFSTFLAPLHQDQGEGNMSGKHN